jgi:hypothetical protein
MSPDAQLLYETRVRNRQVAVAATAGVLVLLASVMTFLGPQAKVSEATLELIFLHKRFPLDLIASVINAVASLATMWTLVFLFDCSRARNPQIGRYIRIIVLIGGSVAAVVGVVYQVVQAINAHKFVTTGHQTYSQANHLLGSPLVLILQLAALVASLLIAVSFVLVSLSALRIGLLPRFLGYLGMVAGALVLFPFLPVPIVQAYWLLALAYLISGRWPAGVPPAWRTGRAELLPSSAEVRARRAAERGGRSKPAPAPTPAPEAAGASGGARTRASTPKRKRKRRT